MRGGGTPEGQPSIPRDSKRLQCIGGRHEPSPKLSCPKDGWSCLGARGKRCVAGLCLLLLGAAADDRVVLRRGDAAPVSVPPQEPGTRRALRREDAAVPPRRRTRGPRGCPRAPPGRRGPPPRRGRADPAGVPAPPPDPGRARGTCRPPTTTAPAHAPSGTTGQTSREGTYERVGECAARPYYECLDCSASDPQFIWGTGSQWFIGPGGCGATVAGMYINDATGDLAALTGSWAEAPFTEENPAIAVECFAPTEAPCRCRSPTTTTPANTSPYRARPI